MSGYAVFDLETTGFSPTQHHRILEIGVVTVSDSGRLEDEWSTLVNPGRDIPNSRVHGITATDVARAPRFGEVVPDLLDRIHDRMLVAHNAPFDLRFLTAELEGAGYRPARSPIPGLDTMRWSSVFISAPSRRLADCCAACGISLTDAHTALADARATAELLVHYLRLLEGAVLPWQDDLEAAVQFPWPAVTGAIEHASLVSRDKIRGLRPDAWLDRIVLRMPRTADAHIESYLATVETALVDGVLAEHEKDQLVALAGDLGISRGRVLDVHADYLWAMAELAWADGVITPEERTDLEHTAAVLGLAPIDVENALAEAADRAEAHPGATSDDGSAAARFATAGIVLEQGDRVVFTGSMQRDRSEWEAMARERGLVPGGVTKKTRLIVAADPNSGSGKAAKARAYGIPIITEDAFARLLGIPA